MRTPFLCLLVGSIAVAGAAFAQVTSNWPTPSKTSSWPAPSRSVNLGAHFWDPAYKRDLSRQHLGVDIHATTKHDVVSPVDGFVIANNTQESKMTQGKAHVVIKESGSGWEHVLGHISSTRRVCAVSLFPNKCPESTRVYKGQSLIGRPMPANQFPVHVHWGINTKSVSAAGGFFYGTKWKLASGKEWGWGMAPAEAELAMACSLGWVNPTSSNKCIR